MSPEPRPNADVSRRPGQLTPVYRPVQVQKLSPCQSACPNSGDIRGWIGAIAQRKKIGLSLNEACSLAWQVVTQVNPFPSTLGRVCPHPCEAACLRGKYDEPVAINALERFLGDWALAAAWPLERIDDGPSPEHVAVVGAGPAGLSFAFQMARRGYRVTMYEAKDHAGGMLRYGVPCYRLPRHVLDAEIDRILALGVQLEFGVTVGRDLTMSELSRSYSAIFVGIGAQRAHRLNVPGEQGPSVYSGIDYLARVSGGEQIDLGGRIVVIGGGNTAIDAARTARRAGAQVTILYRRSRAQMPASQSDVDDALEEGVDIVFLTAPVSVERSSDGRLTAVVATRLTLGNEDASGRARPIPIPGSAFAVCADAVLVAVSQAPMLAGLESLDTCDGWLVPDSHGRLRGNVLAGGDAVELGFAGHAITQGRRAAEALHASWRGFALAGSRVEVPSEMQPVRIIEDSKSPCPSARAPRLPAAETLSHGTAEVVGTISEEQFLNEADRCFSCGSCFGCDQCAMFCTPHCFTRLEEPAPGMYFALDLTNCIECGKCIEVCPCGCLEVA